MQNNYLVQAKTEDGWRDVARRESMDSAERFAELRQEQTGIQHRACNWLPTLSPEQLSEGDVTEERR